MNVVINSRKRIDKPQDTLRKRQVLFSGEPFHEFLQLPGKYLRPCLNELPTDENKQKRADATYYGEIDGKLTIFNPEDESQKVGQDELFQSYDYNTILKKGFKEIDVYSVITTQLPLSKCIKAISVDYNLIYSPDIKSYVTNYDGDKILSRMTKQISDYGNIISDVDAIKIIMLPFMFQNNQDKVLEKSCVLLKEAKLENEEFRNELILQKQCVIHKFAKTFEDIERLEDVIGLKLAGSNLEYPDNWYVDALFSSGRVKGRVEGSLEMAVRFKEVLGIDEVVRISGFSREEIERFNNSK